MAGKNKTQSSVTTDKKRLYKISLSIAFGLIGFWINFYPLNFIIPPHKASMVLGLVFPMLISIAWGWKYGLLSITIGLGGQTMWFLWLPINGWAPFVSVPLYNLWILWHGWCANKAKKNILSNLYVAEIPFRLLSSFIHFTVFPWVFRFNPSPWAPQMTRTVAPEPFVHFVLFKLLFEGLLILLLVNMLINFRVIKRLLLIHEEDSIRTGSIISVSVLFGLVFWLISGVADHLFSKQRLDFLLANPNPSLADTVALHVPPHELFTRVAFLLTCLVAGLLISSYVVRFKRSQLEQVKMEERFRTIMDSLEAMVYVADMETYELLFLNRSGQQVFGDVVGEACWKVLQTGQTGPCEFCTNDKIITSDGEATGIYVWEFQNTATGLWFECRDQAIRWPDGRLVRLEMANDITAKKKAEEEGVILEKRLRQAEKMEAIGILAGGIAHDFNNILGIILGNTELAIEAMPEGSKEKDELTEVIKAINRAKALVNQILSFSRKSEQELIPIKPQVVVQETIKMLRATIPTTVEIRGEINPGCETIIADPTQIHQVIMNLSTNAVQAMSEKGVLDISLKQVFIEKGDPSLLPGMVYGPYVRLSVSDTGFGMSPKVVERVFEPFFTTKGVGKGTGMGLAVVHGIVMAHHGMIKIDSKEGVGTTIHVYFPVAGTEETELPPAVLSVPTGNERILFVDDETMLVQMGTKLLENQGFQVVPKTDSLEALETFRLHPDDFDLVITDQTMPEMSGLELTAELLKIRPDLPVILCTGYSSKVSEESVEALGIRKVIMKPYNREQVVNNVRKVLNGKI